ncbi:uncharacterized protein E0L32_000109 [Thyridium curvatum]|uniref:Uncharacterized protein n=1 Tax=Thyridium curvatum TaxID=1093900 RepID=A0A507AYA4_9PEZI|nr:uncharacterized protein E0L32_000109 [Thyridium curvatum]TPX15775.1 hypothetical protein E0L32_000109 [Thyridium curvatum]
MTSAPPRTPPSSAGKGYSMLPPVPAPLQRLFDLFPLRTLPANALPAAASLSFFSSCSSPSPDEGPALFVFTTDDAARRGAPSFNPSCLKWQTYLRARRVPHRTVPSTNHASPSGALPFLLVAPAPEAGAGPKSSPSAQQQQQQQPKYIAASALPAYIASHAPAAPTTAAAAAADQPAQDPRAALYAALLETAVRPAYLHALYIVTANTPLMQDLYVNPSTRSRPVRASLSRQLRRAAEAEVRRAVVAASGGRSPLDAEDPARLLAEARAAFAALAELLSANSRTASEEQQQEQQQQQRKETFFFGGDGQGGPGLFDASVFAYTHLLLGGELAWADRSLAQAAEEFPALVEHRRRVYEACWGRSA